MDTFTLAVLIIVIALIFDYINGFHDAANSIATVVATRVLTPFQAVVWAAFFNFAAAFIFGEAVAKTVGKGFVDIKLVDAVRHHGGPDRRHHLGPHHVVAGAADQFLARADRRVCRAPRWRTSALMRGFRHSFEALNFGATGEWPFTLKMIIGAPLIGMIARVFPDDRRVLALPELQPLAHGQVLPQAAVALGRGVQPVARVERRAEDRRHHHRRPVHRQVHQGFRGSVRGC